VTAAVNGLLLEQKYQNNEDLHPSLDLHPGQIKKERAMAVT
jgi:hypothetical protein